MISRRKFIGAASALVAAGAAWLSETRAARAAAVGSGVPADGFTPVPGRLDDRRGPGGHARIVVPNGTTLPWRLVDGVKVYHLVAEPVRHEFAPGLVGECWGYNGRTPGPVIEAVEGDRARIYVTNKLPEATSVHWHGVILPNGMDGVSGLTQPEIPAGQTFKYEFRFTKPGTFMYHPHLDEMTQMALGMQGMIVVYPRGPQRRIDRDFAIMLSEWLIRVGTRRPDPTEMIDFNILTMNSRAFPGIEPLVVRRGDRVRIRLGNLGVTDHHPIHIHGHAMRITGTDGGPIAEAGQWLENTVLVPVGTVREVEFVADNPGDWPLHCHMTHHVMNQMGHGLPNVIGIDPAGLDERVQKLLPDYMTMGHTGMDMMLDHAEHMAQPPNSIAMRGVAGPFGRIDMGGMFTIIKVREGITSGEDPGWYDHPPGTVAAPATAEELRRDLEASQDRGG